MRKALNERKEHFKNYSNMKVNHDLYKPEILKIEPSTLQHSLENPKGNYVHVYVDS
jgi:hypothetical protein